MSIATFNNFNMSSLNGLVDINADTIRSDTIHSEDINTTTVSTETLYINDIDVGSKIEENAQKLTAIEYTDTPTPTTTISSNLIVEELAEFDANVNITGNLDCGNNVFVRDVTDPNTVFMRLYYDPAGYGFRFLMDAPNRYMYFSVKDGAGNIKSFQFNSSQVYNNIPFYNDNNITLGSNRYLYFGEALGSSIRYVNNPDVAAGWQCENRIDNYYTNFINRNTIGTTIYVLRLHHSKIISLIEHEFMNNIIVNGVSISPTVMSYLSGVSSNIQTQLNSKLNLTGGTISSNLTVSGNLAVSGNLNTTGISNFQIVNINGVAYNFNWTYFYSDIIFANLGGRISVLGGTFVTQTDLSRITNLTSNAQTQINSLASNQINFYAKTGGTITGNVSINGTTSFFNDLIFANSIVDLVLLSGTVTLTQTEISQLSGITSNIQTQLNNRLSLSGGTLTGSLHIGGSTSTTNRMTQPIIADDTSGGPNLMKYTTMSYRSAGTTANPILTMVDTINNNALWAFPNLGAGSYNSIVTAGSRGFIAGTPINNNSLVLTTWSNTLNGIRIFANNSSHAEVNIRAGNTSSIIVNNTTGIAMSNTASIGFTDATSQTTAFTTAKNDKLVNIGQINSLTFFASSPVNLISSVIYNCGSIALGIGTYMLTCNCGFWVVTGSVLVGQIKASHSLSSVAFTTFTNSASTHCGNITYPVGAEFVLTTTTIVNNLSVQNYFMICEANFNIPDRIAFVPSISSFQAIRIA